MADTSPHPPESHVAELLGPAPVALLTPTMAAALVVGFAVVLEANWDTVQGDVGLHAGARAVGDLIDALAGGDDTTTAWAELDRLAASLLPSGPGRRERT